MGKIAYVLLGIFLMLLGWLWYLGNNMDPLFFESWEHRERSVQILYIVFFVIQGLGIFSFFKAYKHSKKQRMLQKMRDDAVRDRIASHKREQDRKIDELKSEIKELKKNDADNDDEDVNPYVNPKK